MLDYLSAFCLVAVSLICWAGVFAKAFNDNLLQCVGLIGIGTWSAARAWQLLDYAFTTPQQLSMHMALLLYATGTAYKVWRNRPRKPNADPPPPRAMPPEHLRHVAGGKGVR
jgi:hypothetical protein